MVKPAGDTDRIAAQIQSVVQTPYDVHQSNGIDIENCRGIRVIAQLGRIASEAENILQADRRSPQQVRLDAQQVAVATGIVQQRFDAGLLNLDTQDSARSCAAPLATGRER